MGVNPLELFQALNTNPQQFIKKALGNNPIASNLMDMIGSKDGKGLEQMARNMAKEKGLDADEMFKTYKQKLGL